MVDGKNLPVLAEMYKTETKKDGLKKDGTPNVAMVDWLKLNFTAHKGSLVKNFKTCTKKIDDGEITAEECKTEATDKTYAKGSVYLPPAFRQKQDIKNIKAKYGIEF